MSSVFITCAVTGSGDTVGKSDKVPVTPEQIADDCIAAARAGAAVTHIHVRDPITGAGAREPDLYAEVVERVRASDVDMDIKLTPGMGGDLTFGSGGQTFGALEISPASFYFAAPFCAALMIVFWNEKLLDPARRDPLGDVHL